MTPDKIFSAKYMGFYEPSLWWRIKMWFVGEKIEEVSNGIYAEWYLHNGKLYLTKYKQVGLL
jgi:hypothetical protein